MTNVTLKTLPSNIKCFYTDSKAMLVISLAICIKYNNNVGIVYDLDGRSFDVKEGENIILISTLLTEGYLTEKELDSIVAHEEGYILNGDLDLVENKISLANEYCADKENLADLHAIKLFGKDVFKIALLKTVMLTQKHCFVQRSLSKRNKECVSEMSNIIADRMITIESEKLN